jgi:hypothetical protein
MAWAWTHSRCCHEAVVQSHYNKSTWVGPAFVFESTPLPAGCDAHVYTDGGGVDGEWRGHTMTDPSDLLKVYTDGGGVSAMDNNTKPHAV